MRSGLRLILLAACSSCCCPLERERMRLPLPAWAVLPPQQAPPPRVCFTSCSLPHSRDIVRLDHMHQNVAPLLVCPLGQVPNPARGCGAPCTAPAPVQQYSAEPTMHAHSLVSLLSANLQFRESVWRGKRQGQPGTRAEGWSQRRYSTLEGQGQVGHERQAGGARVGQRAHERQGGREHMLVQFGFGLASGLARVTGTRSQA